MKYLYGPVPSRRLGRSLGIDIIPYKICSFDCIYCQLGCTTQLSKTPNVLINSIEAISELEEWLKGGKTADYITLAGSGEPTLNSEIGKMIRGIKNLTDIPVAVITNSSLFSDKTIREAVYEADLLVPSLDAGCENTFLKINRPHMDIKFENVVSGLVALSEEYQNDIWLEVMLVSGINDSKTELLLMHDIISQIAPDRVQVSTVDRPSRSGVAGPLSQEQLNEASHILYPGCEVISYSHSTANVDFSRSSEQDLVNLLRRRPCRLGDICIALGFHKHEAIKILRKLVEENIVVQADKSTDPFYQLISPNS